MLICAPPAVIANRNVRRLPSAARKACSRSTRANAPSAKASTTSRSARRSARSRVALPRLNAARGRGAPCASLPFAKEVPTMNNGIITKAAALRIAMATRVLSEVNSAALVAKLGDHLGLPVTEEKLAKVTVADLKLILSGEETVEPDVDSASIKLAVRHLWGDSGDADVLPTMDAYAEGDMPGSLRVAVASNTEENLDGHFGSCPR